MNTSMTMIIFIIIMVPIFIISMFTPFITRKTESFGVYIPEDIYQDPLLKEMRKQYVSITGALSLMVIAGFFLLVPWLGGSTERVSLSFSVSIVFYMTTAFIVYFVFHKKMKKLKAQKGWTEQRQQQVTVDLQFREKKLIFSNLWFIVSFIISFATLITTFVFYENIPNRIPMQYNFNGEVTNWSDKSYRSVMIMPVMQIYLTLLFLFINTMIANAKQQTSSANPAKSIEQNVQFRRRWSAFIILTGTALTLMFSFIQISFIFPVNSQLLTIIPLIFSGGVIVGAIILSFNTGQGGSRINTGIDSKGEVIDRDDDRYWKLGQIYYNKKDPALFLEKRFGIGWTINFARPLAWTVLVLIVLLAIAIPMLLGE
ncbi:DUF1648 domain-containing protein [Sediminibacillus albus]|uniref:Uncharacterized membrane protein n=1 Tax=Sediminibacillus albus TaxID=407036 RepID=A0A1G9AIS1_9BACI|nr:DUF5808 domain-containing protein [Sediminibacillus albus]SDK27249.1 Uncharacterized membrane protein [Sediminibacillus albus]